MTEPDGGVIWLTGLSGAGKTTVARLLDRRLRAAGGRPVLLDGDVLRALMPVRLGHTRSDRLRLARTYSRLAAELAAQGHWVICATISLFHEVHDWNREHIANYLEVWLRVPAAVLAARAKPAVRRAVDVVGGDIQPELPARPDLVIDNHRPYTPARAAAAVYAALAARTERVAA